MTRSAKDTHGSDSRRLEELALNASGAPHSLVYDGWLLGYRPGPTPYLQVTAENGPALALYSRFGFVAAHDYWYRAREGERR